MEERRAKARESSNKYAAKNRERERARVARWREKNRDLINARQPVQRRARTDRLKAELYRLLGTCCVQCGMDDLRVLEIDHIHGGGRAQKRGSSHESYLRILVEQAKEGLLQMLYANCHRIKTYDERKRYS